MKAVLYAYMRNHTLWAGGLILVEVTDPGAVLLLKATSDFDAALWVFQLNQQVDSFVSAKKVRWYPQQSPSLE
jgi:hypothetical protein